MFQYEVNFSRSHHKNNLHMIILTELKNDELILRTLAISIQTTHKIAMYGNKVTAIRGPSQ